MPSNVSTQVFETGNVSFRATADVVGKRFLAPSADRTGGLGLSTNLENVYRMAHAAANGPTSGVSKYDVANGTLGAVHGQPGMIVPVTADGAVAAGEEVIVGSAGKAKKYTAPTLSGNSEAAPNIVKVGLCMSGGADGADLEVKLY